MAMMILLLRSISTGAPVRSNRGPMATWSTGMANNAMKKKIIVRIQTPDRPTCRRRLPSADTVKSASSEHYKNVYFRKVDRKVGAPGRAPNTGCIAASSDELLQRTQVACCFGWVHSQPFAPARNSRCMGRPLKNPACRPPGSETGSDGNNPRCSRRRPFPASGCPPCARPAAGAAAR